MKEKVGYCTICGKELFCENGFLNAILENDHTLVCFPCEERKKKDVE
ncbi:hypothetical protein SAMN04487936_1177 [Halobacillus dabanensis]|uniref:Uncharacterized protein n=1 Tax=Halobacillus dabanensis TaxID=240302 RepID=A0A1I4AC84_HALDA|nr:hypothetical protein SAMN04487936_1177 [Halobacillus dabanensis]